MRRTRARALPVLACAATIALLGGCTAPADPPAVEVNPVDDERTSTASVQENLEYGSAGETSLLLDACLPPISDSPTAALIFIHGGGFERGNKESGAVAALCRDAAEMGVAGFAIDYRLAPAFTYPAQVDDLSMAVEWLRTPEQAGRFGIDPERIGLFGSSAGAIMASWVGTAGEGSTSEGARVAAVVALSPAVELTERGLGLGNPSDDAVQLILQYLGCPDITECARAEEASPIAAVDPTDPPFFIAIGKNEIVPVEQAKALKVALEDAGVPVVLEARPGQKHAAALLDEEMRADISSFLREHLGVGE